MNLRLSQLVAAMERIAPTSLAEAWDNVGLLVGDPAQPLHRALLCIDYTPQTAAEATAQGCDAVVAYHPFIFQPVKRITAPSLIHDAIRRGVAIYSPHTALDVADGGTNDMLADALGLTARCPLRPAGAGPCHCKLVVFVPESHVDAVSRALFDAGAGWIGNYSCCSFRTPGTGTFHGEAGSSPAVGRAGRLEQVAESRLEVVLPLGRIEPALAAMRKAHPYEEPAFDLVQLIARPASRGMGRIGQLPAPTSCSTLIARIKRELAIGHLLVAGPTDRSVSRVAACAGACGDLLDDALRGGAELYLTGEMRHHDALRAAAAGVAVICTLHSNSERAVLKRVAARLAELLPDLAVVVSRTDRDPFAVA